MPHTTTQDEAKTEAKAPALCFRSTAHPGDASAAAVYSRAMVRPLGAALTPVMLATLAAVLAGQRIWPQFVWGMGLALTAAWSWARFQLSRTLAEVQVRADRRTAAMRSVRDVVRSADPEWRRLVRVRTERVPPALRLHLGDTSHRLLTHRWPQADELRKALRQNSGPADEP
ncbi:MAG: hypothetical protein BRD46_01410 [Bacteroidetes bacterium QS_8_68_15]|nr:MAG: hypothetical protein BRD46_01410 [Bacteroidetes bacterium QS_8_68_15]